MQQFLITFSAYLAALSVWHMLQFSLQFWNWFQDKQTEPALFPTSTARMVNADEMNVPPEKILLNVGKIYINARVFYPDENKEVYIFRHWIWFWDGGCKIEAPTRLHIEIYEREAMVNNIDKKLWECPAPVK